MIRTTDPAQLAGLREALGESDPHAASPIPSPSPSLTRKPLRLPDSELHRFFGPGSDAGKANELAMRAPAIYSASRERAQELNLVGEA